LTVTSNSSTSTKTSENLNENKNPNLPEKIIQQSKKIHKDEVKKPQISLRPRNKPLTDITNSLPPKIFQEDLLSKEAINLRNALLNEKIDIEEPKKPVEKIEKKGSKIGLKMKLGNPIRITANYVSKQRINFYFLGSFRVQVFHRTDLCFSLFQGKGAQVPKNCPENNYSCINSKYFLL